MTRYRRQLGDLDRTRVADARQLDLTAVRPWRRAAPDGEHQRFIHARYPAAGATVRRRLSDTTFTASLIEHEPALPEHDDLVGLVVEADRSLKPDGGPNRKTRLRLPRGRRCRRRAASRAPWGPQPLSLMRKPSGPPGRSPGENRASRATPTTGPHTMDGLWGRSSMMICVSPLIRNPSDFPPEKGEPVETLVGTTHLLSGKVGQLERDAQVHHHGLHVELHRPGASRRASCSTWCPSRSAA